MEYVHLKSKKIPLSVGLNEAERNWSLGVWFWPKTLKEGLKKGGRQKFEDNAQI